MSMINTGDILETIEMFTQDNLDVRTVTMGTAESEIIHFSAPPSFGRVGQILIVRR